MGTKQLLTAFVLGVAGIAAAAGIAIAVNGVTGSEIGLSSEPVSVIPADGAVKPTPARGPGERREDDDGESGGAAVGDDGGSGSLDSSGPGDGGVEDTSGRGRGGDEPEPVEPAEPDNSGSGSSSSGSGSGSSGSGSSGGGDSSGSGSSAD